MSRCFECRREIDDRQFRCDECVKGIQEGRIVPGNFGVASRENPVMALDKKLGNKVTGRDLVQPYTPDGKRNEKFVELYGDGIYHGTPSQLDGTGKPVKKRKMTAHQRREDYIVKKGLEKTAGGR